MKLIIATKCFSNAVEEEITDSVDTRGLWDIRRLVMLPFGQVLELLWLPFLMATDAGFAVQVYLIEKSK